MRMTIQSIDWWISSPATRSIATGKLNVELRTATQTRPEMQRDFEDCGCVLL
jgi:hypothetical protein